MSRDGTILLISDRPDGSQKLAHRLRDLCHCRTIGLDEEVNTAETVTAVITDVGFRHPPNIERLRHLLSRSRAFAAPIVAILRDGSRLERIQASAIGATSLLPPSVSASAISAVLSRTIGLPLPQADSTKSTPVRNVEQARLQFRGIFDAVARDEFVTRTGVDNATASVMDAVADGGIRQWLEVVWTYHDATYQHCLLVTGLAAEFAAGLQFAVNDRKHVVRGALLHDIGKAKIPLAILNKPAALTLEEMAIVQTHPGIGYEILRGQDGYEPELLEVVLRHHELLDGTGYPDGLSGPQISDLVRLVTICDIYAALIERRPYKKPMEPAQAFNILQEMEGKLEGALVRAFAKVAKKSAPAPDLG
jgi:putative nucleotidyltransferase with HDIG domain